MSHRGAEQGSRLGTWQTGSAKDWFFTTGGSRPLYRGSASCYSSRRSHLTGEARPETPSHASCSELPQTTGCGLFLRLEETTSCCNGLFIRVLQSLVGKMEAPLERKLCFKICIPPLSPRRKKGRRGEGGKHPSFVILVWKSRPACNLPTVLHH